EGRSKSITLSAAVVDDVIGLIILAVFAVVLKGGTVTVGMVVKTAGLAVGFLVVSIVVGVVVAPIIGRFLSSIHTGIGMKFAMAVAFCTVFGWSMIQFVDFEKIIGAFAAGLVMRHFNFRDFNLSHQVERMSRWSGALYFQQRALREEMDAIRQK